MKKGLLSALMLITALVLVACGGQTEPDITPPVLSGVDNVTIFMNTDFDPMAGVSAVDDVDGDLTNDIVVTGNVDVSTPGTYFLRYVVEDSAGNRTERQRFIDVVVDPDLAGDDMVPNGDFELGTAFWTTTTGLEGGTANLSVISGELNVEITGVTGGLWEPRLENIGITFEQGTAYRVSFDARALEPRAVHVQVGELLSSAPWFLNFKPGQTTIFDLTTEMQTFSFDFAMGLDTNENGALLFEMGTVPMSDGTTGALLTTIIYDNIKIEPIEDFVDDVPPMFSGVGNRTIELGNPFNPLAGVTATDNVDGDVTDQITIEGEVDVDTLGEYTLTYTVSDAAGNEATATRVITVAEPISDDAERAADFGWRLFLNDWDGTEGTLSAAGGELTLNLTNINVSENWQVQIIQDAVALGTGEDDAGSLNLEAGKTYRVSFNAHASVAGEATLVISHAVGGFNPYIMEVFNVTEESERIVIEFTLDDDAIDYSVPAQFKLEMGLLFAGLEEGSFTLSDVVIEVQEEDAFVETNLIVNGQFTEIVSGPSGDAVAWRAFLNDWEGTAGNLSIDQGRLVLDLTAINAYANWNIQIIQDAFALGTGEDNEGSLELEAGNTYRVTFDARASVEGDVDFVLSHFVPDFTAYAVETFTVGRSFKTFTFIITLDDEDMDYSVPAQFKFEMGNLFAGESSGQFVLNNVRIDIEEDGEFVPTDLIVNGDFNTVSEGPSGEAIGWRAFLNNWEGTAGNLAIIDGRLVLDLTEINAYANWNIQIIQDAFALGTGDDNVGSLQLEAGKTYRVTFDALASKAGEVTFLLSHMDPDFTAYFEETFTVERGLNTFTFIVTLDDEDMDYAIPAQFKLEMGDLFAGETSGQFILNNVVIEVEEDEAFVATDLIVNGDFNVVSEGPSGAAVGWRGFLNDWEGTAGELSIIDGRLVLDLTAVNAYANWNIQLIQDAFALGTGDDNVGSLELEAGKTYRVTFDALASKEGDVDLVISHMVPDFTAYYTETFTVKRGIQTFTFTITLDDEDMDYSVPAQFKIEMGNLFSGETRGQFILDNVVIEVEEDDAFVATELLVNGDFNTVEE